MMACFRTDFDNHLTFGNFERKAPFSNQYPFPARMDAFAASTNSCDFVLGTLSAATRTSIEWVLLWWPRLLHIKRVRVGNENTLKSTSSPHVECAMAKQAPNIARMVLRTLLCVRSGSRILRVGHVLHPLCVRRREASLHW